jgi:hypothetical protein
MALLLIIFVSGCKDESVGISDKLATTIYGFARKKQNAASQFYAKDANPMELDFSWSTADLSVKVRKVEFYISFREPYLDQHNNLKIANHGGDRGVLLKTWEGVELPSTKQPKTLTCRQQELYELFKDAKFDYEGNGSLVSVFSNPARPERVEGARFIEGDEFKITWVLHTTNGVELSDWPAAVCTESTESNCSFSWSVKCEYKAATFVDDYICHEPRYTDYPVAFTKRDGTNYSLVNNNFWNIGAVIEYRIDQVTKKVVIPAQGFSIDGLTYVVSGTGTIDTCTGDIVTDYTITKNDGTRNRTVETNVHTFRKAQD